MKKNIFRCTIVLIMFILLASCAAGSKNSRLKEPTAIIVDAETGKPIEGAVALSVWWDYVKTAWFEGGTLLTRGAKKEIESISDKEGKVYIEDFWDWHWSAKDYPTLMVYKCGYKIWHQFRMDRRMRRTRFDFDKDSRIVRLEKRPSSFVEHSHLFGDLTDRQGDQILKTYKECELKDLEEEGQREYLRRKNEERRRQ